MFEAPGISNAPRHRKPAIRCKRWIAMANVYVEARSKGRREGSAIDDYVVEDHADHVLGTFRTPLHS